MRIEQIAYRLGSKKVNNDDLINVIKTYSEKEYDGDLQKALDQIDFYLKLSGAENRQWLAENETPIGLICEAIEEVLKKANLEEVDLIIHVGMYRGFDEPDQASFISQALGKYTIGGYDITKACNGWVRALEVAYSYLKTYPKRYKNILVVNTECFGEERFGERGPSCFKIDNYEDVFHIFPVLTTGDGVSATLLTNSDQKWHFDFQNNSSVADSCSVPREGYKGFALPSEKLAARGEGRLYSFMKDLHVIGVVDAVEQFKKNVPNHESIDWIIPHGHSYNLWIQKAEKLGVAPYKLKFNVYKDNGNMASACIPIGLAKGIESGEIKRGQELVFWTASSGMEFTVITFKL